MTVRCHLIESVFIRLLLISLPILSADFYEFHVIFRCVEQVKNSQYIDLAHDLEIDKAIMFLKQKDFNQAIETLKSFEKKDSKVACTAATNLSFLYFLVSVFNINIWTPYYFAVSLLHKQRSRDRPSRPAHFFMEKNSLLQ